ncbi:SRPBCC family protein [Halobacterium rubrum]|uniref:SRPBCC family protein n=1 Tax=Halobacterium TaxID=2239 RepID=UPI001F1C850B|nr:MULTISPECIES: SRPBCC family protein [Halobacterium]MDH5019755.1 SRPBCC family protein [Halobacterium rubrum]
MFTVEQQVRIDSPPGEVFSFLDDPRNHVKVTPGLVDVADVEALASGGKRAEYRYKLAGVELVGVVEDVERVPGSRLVQRLTGAIDGTITYELAGDDNDDDGATDLTYEAEYDLPDTVIESVLAPIAEAYNRREARATVENLKTFLEN